MMKHRKCHKLMEKHTCEVCGKVVVGEFRIRFHMKTHNRPDKPHHCDQCPRSFVTQEGLDVHKKLHDGNPDWVPWSRQKQKKSDRPQRADGPHKCEEPNCGKSFFKPYNLQVHMALHATSFSCAVCEKTFNRVRELRRHLNKLHETENKSYFCIHCDKGYTMKQSFDIHKTVAHPSKGKVPCDEDYCTEEFDDADLLREHLKTHLEGDNHQETQTEKTEVTVASADNHDATTPAENIDLASTSTEVKQQTTEETTIEDQLSKDELEAMKPGIHTCDRCNWSFSKKLSLTLHKLVHTPRNEKNMYPCVLCEDKAFAVVDSLQTHYNRLHGPKIKPYLCLKCGIRFHRKESFIPHMKMHDDRASNATFECTTCKKKFRDSLGLEKHMRTHDSANSRKCKECDETFTSKLSLMYHNHAKHGMERPFKCDVDGCGKGFFNQHQLTDHKICHTEGKYQCTLCPKKFRRHHNLADHILVHKQEKNHICDFCGKAFVKKSSLNLHLAIHSGEKNYKCPHCPKAFCRKYARDCHIRVHTKETPFSCKICGRKFGQYTSMRNHLKVHLKLNSSVILRRPFKKTLAAGTPLVEKLEIAESSNATATEGTDNNVIPKHEEVPTASGIIHEALQAAFQDINMDLETAVKEDEDVAEQENDEGADEESEPELEVPVVKRRRGRPKKSKDFICGICGKAFVREKPYAAHVERHLNEDGQNDTSVSYTTTNPSQPEVSHGNLSMPELIPSSAVMLPVIQPDIHPLTLSRQTFLTNPSPAPQVLVPPTRKSARRVSNKAPGSRLAQIVEDVIEAATNKGASNVVATSSATTTNIIQNHFHQESIPQDHNHHHHHNMPQNHHNIQSPPPHHISQPNSERSTPTGSIHSPSPIPTTTTTPSTTTAFPSSSFLSPFLYANPYLLPRQPQQGEQQLTSDSSVQFQGQTFSGFPNVAQNNRQQPQQQQQFQYQHNQMQYQHNVQQQHPSHRSPNTMPQDLSKSSYNLLFFGNSR